MKPRPNLIYFHVHDLGRHLPVYGVPVAAPHLAKFATQAVTFTHAFCSSTACTPSRGCALSGRYAHSTGCIGLAHMGWPLPLAENTVADDFRAAGYQTILSGVNHERHPRSDRYEIDVTRHWDDWRTERAVDNALAALDGRDAARPFFLNVGSQQPHASTWHLFADAPVPPDEVWTPTWCPDTPMLRREFGKFQAAIKYMDHHFGRLVDGLRQRGLLDSSAIVFTTDHGISGPRAKSLLYDRGTEIALMVRLPGGEHGGELRDTLVGNVDFRPTWAAMLGVPLVSEAQGKSFAEAFWDAGAAPSDAVFMERNYHGERPFRGATDYLDKFDPIRAVRTRHLKYIWNLHPEARTDCPLPFDAPQGWDPLAAGPGDGLDFLAPETDRPRPEIELYDLRHDPQEFINLAGRPEYAAAQADLRQRLDQWMRATGDFAPAAPPPRPEEPGWGRAWV
jgi:arylsulfatase A-like enzyme